MVFYILGFLGGLIYMDYGFIVAMVFTVIVFIMSQAINE